MKSQVLLLIYKLIIPSQTVMAKKLPNLWQMGLEKLRMAIWEMNLTSPEERHTLQEG